MLVTESGVAQGALLTIVQVTTSPLASEALEYVEVLAPTVVAFTCHIYVGVGPPLVAVAVNVTLSPSHMVLPGLAATVTDVASSGLTVMVMLLLVTSGGTTHGALLVRSQVTTSPLFSVVVLKVEALVPAGKPFTYHWYDGVGPPFVIVAVKVTLSPAHIVLPGAAVIVIVAVMFGFTVIVIGALNCVGFITQGALLVTWQVIMSPVTRVLLV